MGGSTVCRRFSLFEEQEFSTLKPAPLPAQYPGTGRLKMPRMELFIAFRGRKPKMMLLQHSGIAAYKSQRMSRTGIDGAYAAFSCC